MRNRITQNKEIKIKKSWPIKQTFLVLTSLIAVTNLTVSAKEADFTRAQKELKIMSNIFETTLNQVTPSNRHIMGAMKTQATYLAKQGMVFSFNFAQNPFTNSQNWAAFGEGVGEFVGSVASEVGAALSGIPLPPGSPVDIEEHLEVYTEKMQALEEMRQRQQEQREEVRQLQREIRRMERDTERARFERDDLERENTDRNSSKRSVSEKIKAQLEQKIEVLEEKMAEYKKSMVEYRNKRDKKYSENVKQKSDTIISTLCDYGGTLRSLENNEHITLIFKDYADNKDQIHVFEYNQVRGCDSKEKLLRSAISYQL